MEELCRIVTSCTWQLGNRSREGPVRSLWLQCRWKRKCSGQVGMVAIANCLSQHPLSPSCRGAETWFSLGTVQPAKTFYLLVSLQLDVAPAWVLSTEMDAEVCVYLQKGRGSLFLIPASCWLSRGICQRECHLPSWTTQSSWWWQTYARRWSRQEGGYTAPGHLIEMPHQPWCFIQDFFFFLWEIEIFILFRTLLVGIFICRNWTWP